MAYLRGLRMDRAKRLLREEELTVAQVADAVGFSDPYHFSRVFRQHVGMPPSRYRDLSRDPARSDFPSADAWRGGYDSFAGVSFFSIPPREES
jgi:AraC-like DNA-binding protein